MAKSAPDPKLIEKPIEPANPHVGSETPLSRFELAALKNEVKRALVQMKFTKLEATSAVEAAAAHTGSNVTLEKLIPTAARVASGARHRRAPARAFEALRRCPRPCT